MQNFKQGTKTLEKKSLSLEDIKKQLELDSDLPVEEIAQRLQFENAIKRCDLKQTQKFLKDFPYATITNTKNYNNTLHFAIRALHNHIKTNKETDLSSAILILKALIIDNADINKKNIHGNTPLHEAIKLGNLSFIIFLIKEGADISISNNKGETPLHLAAQHSDPAIMASLFLTSSYSKTNKIDWSSKNSEGETPHDIATQAGNLEVTRFIEDQNLYALYNKSELDPHYKSQLEHRFKRNFQFIEMVKLLLSDKLYILAQKDPRRFRTGFSEFMAKTAQVKDQEEAFKELLNIIAEHHEIDSKILIQVWLAQYPNWKETFPKLATSSIEINPNISLDSMFSLFHSENDEKSYEFQALSSNNFEENIIQLLRKYLGNEVFDEIFPQNQNFQAIEEQALNGEKESASKEKDTKTVKNKPISHDQDDLKDIEKSAKITARLIDVDDFEIMAKQILIDPEAAKKHYALDENAISMVWNYNFNLLAAACNFAEESYEQKRGKERPIKQELDKINKSTQMTAREKYIALAGLIVAKVNQKNKKHKEQFHQQAIDVVGLSTQSTEEIIFKPIIHRFIPTAIHDECIEAYNGYLNGTLYFRPVHNKGRVDTKGYGEEVEKQKSFKNWLKTQGKFSSAKDHLETTADRKFFLEDTTIEKKWSDKNFSYQRMIVQNQFGNFKDAKDLSIYSIDLLRDAIKVESGSINVQQFPSYHPHISMDIHRYAFYQLMRQLPSQDKMRVLTKWDEKESQKEYKEIFVKEVYGENTVVLKDEQLSNLINYFIVHETPWEDRNFVLLGFIFNQCPDKQYQADLKEEKEKGSTFGAMFGSIKAKTKETKNSFLSTLKYESEKSEKKGADETSGEYKKALAHFEKAFQASSEKNKSNDIDRFAFRLKCMEKYEEYGKKIEATKEVKSSSILGW